MANRNISIANAEICFTNFRGNTSTYNTLGRKRFCVLLPDDLAEDMKTEGWNVRYLIPKDPNSDEPPRPYVQVDIRFDHYPPKIVVINGKTKTVLDEDSIGFLDYAEIANIDLIIRPYNWKMANGKVGVKAMLKNMYVTLVEDEFASKYAEIPDGDLGSLMD